eukprot:scaffold5519_cov166-Amphora_coffeaeformis.AAC.1
MNLFTNNVCRLLLLGLIFLASVPTSVVSLVVVTKSVSGITETTTPSSCMPSSRRAFIRHATVAVLGVVTSTTTTTAATTIIHPQQQQQQQQQPVPAAAHAYERRDVGGEGRSATTAAYNIQAYETNNRLEAQGFKLETQQEQQASLTAALKDYSYTDDSSRNTNNKNKNKINNNHKSKTSSSANTAAKK